MVLIGCASQKSTSTSKVGQGNTRTKPIELLDDNTYLLTEKADENNYGYGKSNPIKVGGVSENSGPKNERRFLNALLGPNGEEVQYYRAGSCCPFKTPHGFIDNSGMLDNYKVTWTGAKDTLDVFINMYDEGDLKIPAGLTAKKQN